MEQKQSKRDRARDSRIASVQLPVNLITQCANPEVEYGGEEAHLTACTSALTGSRSCRFFALERIV